MRVKPGLKQRIKAGTNQVILGLSLVAIFFSMLAGFTLLVDQEIATAASVSTIPTDPADNPANTVVDANCSPAPSDCMASIRAAISGNAARPLKVTFGGSHAPGTVFEFATIWSAESDISIEGQTNTGNGRPVVQVTAGSNVVNIDGDDNLSFRNYDVDMNQCTTSGRMFSVSGTAPTNFHVSNARYYNGAGITGGATCWLFYSNAAGGSGFYMHDIESEYLNKSVFMHTNSTGVYDEIYIQNSTFSDYYISALDFDNRVSNLYIEGNLFDEHAITACGTNLSNGKNSNPVAFQPKLDSNGTIYVEGARVADNTFRGRVGATASDCGGSGDLLAFRGANNFIVEDNFFYDAGEVALTITAGLTNGVVRGNHVENADFTGIQFGNTSATGNSKIYDVDVYNNTIINSGIDVNDRVPDFLLPGIGIWNVKDVCVVNNSLSAPQGMGIWTHDGSWATASEGRFVEINEGIYISRNDVSGSYVSEAGWPDAGEELNYAQSGHPSSASDLPELSNPFKDGTTTTAYYEGLPDEGQDWAATLPGPDADNDGFWTGCYSETDDADPCIPDTAATACVNAGNSDSDQVPDETEDSAPNGGDYNNDGTSDSSQDNVATIINSVAKDSASTGNPSRHTSFASRSGTTITKFEVADEESLAASDSDSDYPLGLFSYNLTVTPGATETVEIFLDKKYDTADWVWKKYNSTSNTYSVVPDSANLATSTQTIAGNEITVISYEVTDGGVLDEDGAANGVIVDPIGPSVSAAELADTGTEATLSFIFGIVVLGASVFTLSTKPKTIYTRYK